MGYTIVKRIDKLSENQVVMIDWFQVLRDNDERLSKDIKKLYYEYQNLKKGNDT